MKNTKARIIAAFLASAIGLSSFSMCVFAGEEALLSKSTGSSVAVDSAVVDPPYTWGSFRADENNNGAVDKKTPKSADDAVLYWATKKGSGFGSNAFGSPIIVDGDIIATAGKELYRLNRFTGEQIGEPGELVGTSNFNIIPPVYSDGMIFVGLSNGRVQAFDADTLESLWVYQDELQGQPNSPLVVHNGYLYTGFWNSETKDANFVCLNVEDEDPTNTTEAKQNTWTYTQTGGFYWAGAYVCDSFVLVGTDDGKSGSTSQTSTLLSLNAKTGEVIDKIENLNGDIRSSVCYDEKTDRYYFTSKGGSFYSVAVNADGTFKEDSLKELVLGGMSTSTPVVYNGRAYIGVSGASQFGAYSGHNITVIDLKSFTVAYTARTKGYPQTSGLLTTAYEDGDGYAYVYFIENYTPGIVRVIKDKPGVTSVIDPSVESANGQTYTDCAPVLFTPSGNQAQYAIASPICDEYGTLYFKNDSAHMMAVGSKPQEIKIEAEPNKAVYTEDASFNPSGLKVTAYFANGLSRDVTDEVTFSENAEKLSIDDTEITVYYNALMYGDQTNPDGSHSSNVQYDPLEAYIDVTVLTASQAESISQTEALIDSIGEVTLESEQAVSAAENAYNALDNELREYVSNSGTLMLARTELDTIKNVYTLIASIGNVDYSKANAIDSALKAYNSLSEEQKAKITNSADLTSASQTLDALKAEINSVKDLINAIGNVTLESEQTIAAARTAYDNLPEASKSGVDNIETLIGAEAVLAKLKNQPVDISNAALSTIKTQTYTGKEITPSVTVKYGDTILKNGTDYTVSYKNNKAIGTATVTVTGKGGFVGSKTSTFKIDAPTVSAVKNLKATATSTTVKLSWSKVSGATSYGVYRYDEKTKTYKGIATVKGTSFTDKNLKPNTTYKYLVRAKKAVGDKTFLSDKTFVTAVTNVSAVKNLKATATSTTVKLSWGKVSGATSYGIYRYDAKTKTYKGIATAKGTSFVDKNLKPNTTYKYLVRAKKAVGDKTFLSDKTFVTAVTNVSAVKNLKATATSTTVKLSWSKVSGATSYGIYRYDAKTKTYKGIATVKGTTFTDKDLKPNTTYKYLVRAKKAVGDKTFLSDKTFVTAKTKK